MSQVAKVHLFSCFLGVGKTTVLKGLMHQKPTSEKWVFIVNEFGEIGIDGAVQRRMIFPLQKLWVAAYVVLQVRNDDYSGKIIATTSSRSLID